MVDDMKSEWTDSTEGGGTNFSRPSVRPLSRPQVQNHPKTLGHKSIGYA